jgi:hypothetical protein
MQGRQFPGHPGAVRQPQIVVHRGGFVGQNVGSGGIAIVSPVAEHLGVPFAGDRLQVKVGSAVGLPDCGEVAVFGRCPITCASGGDCGNGLEWGKQGVRPGPGKKQFFGKRAQGGCFAQPAQVRESDHRTLEGGPRAEGIQLARHGQLLFAVLPGFRRSGVADLGIGGKQASFRKPGEVGFAPGSKFVRIPALGFGKVSGPERKVPSLDTGRKIPAQVTRHSEFPSVDSLTL